MIEAAASLPWEAMLSLVLPAIFVWLWRLERRIDKLEFKLELRFERIEQQIGTILTAIKGEAS